MKRLSEDHRARMSHRSRHVDAPTCCKAVLIQKKSTCVSTTSPTRNVAYFHFAKLTIVSGEASVRRSYSPIRCSIDTGKTLWHGEPRSGDCVRDSLQGF